MPNFRYTAQANQKLNRGAHRAPPPPPPEKI